MDYTLLGNSGLKVSRIALGCMSFGQPIPGMSWTLDDDVAQPILRVDITRAMTRVLLPLSFVLALLLTWQGVPSAFAGAKTATR